MGKCEKLGVPFLYSLHPFSDFSAAEGHVLYSCRDTCNSFYIPGKISSRLKFSLFLINMFREKENTAQLMNHANQDRLPHVISYLVIGSVSEVTY